MKFAAVTLLAILGVASAGKPQLSVSSFHRSPLPLLRSAFVGSSWLMRANVQKTISHHHFRPIICLLFY